MKSTNYKAGDYLTIIKPPQDVLRTWINSWVDNMDQYIGKMLIITSISIENIYFEGTSYGWPLWMLDNQPGSENQSNINYEIF